MSKDKVELSLTVEEAQELHYSLETLANKLIWVIENKPPRNVKDMLRRAKLVASMSENVKKVLNDRAKQPQLKVVR